MEKLKGYNEHSEHCWHQHRGALYVVLPDGFTVQSCCKCGAMRSIHADHAAADGWRGRHRRRVPYPRWGNYECRMVGADV